MCEPVVQASVGVRVHYRELCKYLPAEYFHPCLCKTLEAVFNLLCSHYRMMTWHLERSRAPPAEEGGTEGGAAEGESTSADRWTP